MSKILCNPQKIQLRIINYLDTFSEYKINAKFIYASIEQKKQSENESKELTH
jgi:hypothetical protein